jgi:hypothetical protein
MRGREAEGKKARGHEGKAEGHSAKKKERARERKPDVKTKIKRAREQEGRRADQILERKKKDLAYSNI